MLSNSLRGYKPYEIKGYNDLRSIVQSIENIPPENAIKKVMRAINFEQTYKIGKGDISNKLHAMNSLIKLASKFKTTSSFLYAISQIKKKPKKDNAVTMMSVHGSKGLEFPHVFIVDVNTNIFPDVRSTDMEERRVMYVAITRPKLSLYVYGNSQYVSELDMILRDTSE